MNYVDRIVYTLNPFVDNFSKLINKIIPICIWSYKRTKALLGSNL